MLLHNMHGTLNYFRLLKLMYSLHQPLSLAYFYALFTILYYYFNTSKLFKTYFYKDGAQMNQNSNTKSPQLFLLFNITLLLTFPLTGGTPLLLHLLSIDSLILAHWLPAIIYCSILSSSFWGKRSEYTSMTRIFCFLFMLYHLIHLFFNIN